MKSIVHFVCGFALFAFGSSLQARDLSKLDPFCDYVGHSVELRRPMSVIECSSGWLWDDEGLIVKRHADRGLAEVGQEGKTKIYGILPVGHPIRLIRVSEEAHFDEAGIIAYGRTKLPWDDKEITIAYSWSTYWMLHPAPWEPDNTPPTRSAGIKPPHFDYDGFKGPDDAPKWGLRGRPQTTPTTPPTSRKPATKSFTPTPIITSNRIPDAPRIGDAPAIPDVKW